MRPVVVAVAITGSVPRKKDNPALPTTPAEQIESTHQAFEAGATIAHIHVRNPDESPSSDPALFARVQEGLKQHCPGMIVQFSTGGRSRDQAARGSSLSLKPDMASARTSMPPFERRARPCGGHRKARRFTPAKTPHPEPVPPTTDRPAGT